MMDPSEDPLDLFDDDGDGVIEMCTLFDEKEKKGGQHPSGNSGCCIVFLAMGGSLLLAGWGISKCIV